MSNENSKLDAERAAFEAWWNDDSRLTMRTFTSKHWAEAVWQARASLPVGVPDGYALVPVEPTDEMRDAGNVYTLNRSTLFAIWRAMLAAAPTVKAEQVQCDTCHGQGEICVGQQTFGYMSMQPPEPIMEVCPECGGEEAPSLPAAGSALSIGLPSVAEFGEWIGEESQGIDSATRGMLLALFKWTLNRVCTLNASRVAVPVLAEQPYQDGIAEDLERSDWTPLGALQWYAAGKHFDVVGSRTRIVDTGAVASNALKHTSLAYLELKGDAELSELRAALSAQQSAPERVSVPRELLRHGADLLEAHSPGSSIEQNIADDFRALLASHGRGEA